MRWAWVVVLAGCRIGEVDLSGHPCPCIDGWVCDRTRSVCTHENGGDGKVVVSDFRVEWTTPNTIRWRWDRPDGGSTDLGHYELVTGTSRDDVLQRAGSFRVWTAADNPELDQFALRGGRGVDAMVATVTDGHEPHTTYFGQLTAVDNADARFVSNVVSALTMDAPARQVAVFHDAEPAGFFIPMPPEMTYSSDAPFPGTTHHFLYRRTCAPAEDACFEILRRQNLQLMPFSITSGQFTTTAYFELALASDATFISYWSEIRVSINGSNWFYAPFTVRSDNQYRIIQAPLTAFRQETTGAPLTAADMAAPLFEVGVSGTWGSGARVRIDEIFMSW